MRRQHDERLKYWFAPRENEKPFTESERAQRWRLSLASLLFITVLLSDHLWFCAEAKLTRTRDKRWDKGFAFTDTDEDPNSLHRQHIPPSPDPSRLARKQDVIFLENSTKPLWRMDTCLPDSLSKDCFSFSNAKTVCLALSGGGEKGTPLAYVNLSDLYLSFCNSYSLLDLFYGFTSPDNLNCTLDMAMGVDLLGCTQCIRAYQLIDQLAEDNYREFELLVQKYEIDAYSVRTCMEECKVGLRRLGLACARARTHTHANTNLHAHTHARTRAFKGVGITVVMATIGHICQYRPPGIYYFAETRLPLVIIWPARVCTHTHTHTHSHTHTHTHTHTPTHTDTVAPHDNGMVD